jgi:drug/metabolite transporter (DMT)-like permease
MNPNRWMPGELATIVGVALLVGSIVLYAAVRSLRPGAQRFYWIACCAVLAVGVAGMLLAPPDSPDSGEMPLTFGVGVWVTLLSLLGMWAGAAWTFWRSRKALRGRA